jgi:hypothetical protein
VSEVELENWAAMSAIFSLQLPNASNLHGASRRIGGFYGSQKGEEFFGDCCGGRWKIEVDQ